MLLAYLQGGLVEFSYRLFSPQVGGNKTQPNCSLSFPVRLILVTVSLPKNVMYLFIIHFQTNLLKIFPARLCINKSVDNLMTCRI